ncbi:hypothetical protein EV363DRAFT_1545398 [Boletus edulis]|nr:hypothetical protein EV363DRAFT_1545398 [Boletus edulis]
MNETKRDKICQLTTATTKAHRIAAILTTMVLGICRAYGPCLVAKHSLANSQPTGGAAYTTLHVQKGNRKYPILLGLPGNENAPGLYGNDHYSLLERFWDDQDQQKRIEHACMPLVLVFLCQRTSGRGIRRSPATFGIQMFPSSKWIYSVYRSENVGSYATEVNWTDFEKTCWWHMIGVSALVPPIEWTQATGLSSNIGKEGKLLHRRWSIPPRVSTKNGDGSSRAEPIPLRVISIKFVGRIRHQANTRDTPRTHAESNSRCGPLSLDLEALSER